MTGCKIRFQLLCQLKSCHSRHQHITDYQVRIIRSRFFESGNSIGSHFHLKIHANLFLQELTDIIIILNNQDFPFIQRSRHFILFGQFFRQLFQMAIPAIRFLQQHITGNQKVFLFINCLICRNAHRKHRTATFVISILNSPLMYLYQFMAQMQTYSNTVTGEITLHKTFE